MNNILIAGQIVDFLKERMEAELIENGLLPLGHLDGSVKVNFFDKIVKVN